MTGTAEVRVGRGSVKEKRCGRQRRDHKEGSLKGMGKEFVLDSEGNQGSSGLNPSLTRAVVLLWSQQTLGRHC